MGSWRALRVLGWVGALVLALVPAIYAFLGRLPALVAAIGGCTALYAYCVASYAPDRRGLAVLLASALGLGVLFSSTPLAILAAVVGGSAAAALLGLARRGRWLALGAGIALAAGAAVALGLGKPWLSVLLIGVSVATAATIGGSAARHLRAAPRDAFPYIVANAVVAAAFAADVVVGSAIACSAESTPMLVLGIALILYGAIGFGLHAHEALFVDYSIARIPFRRSLCAALALRGGLRNLFAKYVGKISRLVERAGVSRSPVLYAARYFVTALILFALAPVGVALWLIDPLLGVAIPLLLAVGGVAALLIPIAELASRVGDLKRGTEDELPWFALYAAVMQRAGIPLHESFARIVGRGLLKWIEAVARQIEKRVKVLGRDAVTAMEEVAVLHPSRTFRNFVLGYTSLLRTGGDLATYLEDRVREYLRWLEVRVKSYVETAHTVSGVLTIVFLILTSIFAVGSAVATGSEALFAGFAFLCVPAIFAMVYSYVAAAQPKAFFAYALRVNHFLPAVVGAAAGAVLALHGAWMGWLVLAVLAVALGAAYGVQYSLQMRVAKLHESALEDFLRDLTEFRKIGYPPSRAIQILARERSYNPAFDDLLRRLAHQLALGIPLGEAIERIDTPSWLTRTVLFVLAEIEGSGGGSIEVLEMLTDFVAEIQLERRAMKHSLRLYDVLLVLTPLLLGFMLTISTALGSLIAVLARGLQHPPTGVQPPISIAPPSPLCFELGKLIVAESSIAFAALASKTVDGTLRSTLRLVAVGIALILYELVIDPAVRPLVEGLFGKALLTGG